MEPRFPFLWEGEDPLVVRARGRGEQLQYGNARYGAELGNYFVGAAGLVVFSVIFFGGTWLCMEVLGR